MSTNQRAMMLCGWGIKAGMVRVWVAGKTVWSPCYHGPYLSAPAMGLSHYRALYKCPNSVTLTLTQLSGRCSVFAEEAGAVLSTSSVYWLCQSSVRPSNCCCYSSSQINHTFSSLELLPVVPAKLIFFQSQWCQTVTLQSVQRHTGLTQPF